MVGKAMTNPNVVKKYLAFGVEPNKRRYRLRLARYPALAETIDAFTLEMGASQADRVRLLDAGAGKGRTMRYLAPRGVVDQIEFHAIEYDSHRIEAMYDPDRWRRIVQADLAEGVPYENEAFDVCVCEQVVEHLQDPRPVLRELSRALRPGGLLIVGAPSFPIGLAQLRRHIVPRIDAALGRKRSHIQVYGPGDLHRLVERETGCRVVKVRGFRILSGGLMAPLENWRWWYRVNRWIGERAPSLCVETQVIARKPE